MESLSGEIALRNRKIIKIKQRTVDIFFSLCADFFSAIEFVSRSRDFCISEKGHRASLKFDKFDRIEGIS